jgi:membrane protease YdiL (CAAX protease family)
MADTSGKLTGYLRTAAKILAVLIVALLVTLLFNFGFIAILFVYFLATGGSMDQAVTLLQDSFSSIWFMLGTTVTQEIAWVIVPIAFVVLVDRRRFSWREIGWEFGPRAGKLFLAGIVINGLLGIAIVSTILITGWQQVEINGLTEYGLATVAGYLVLTAVIMLSVGIGEETLFRGYIQTDLMRKYGNLPALLVTSLIFAAIHIVMLISGQEVSPLSIFNIFLASLVMGYLYIITGSICASIGFHFFQDVLAAGVFLTGDLPYLTYPVYLFSKAGDVVLAGVNLGSSDNLINLFWFVVLLAVLYVYDKKVRKSATGK